ncbi:hypothetical protein INT48_003725 [Thamnidium elegans]|uniref:Uncharacterized protein n=1 Tax=Thamnidium elegans TaxID=101142 RepID=A0A8H7SLU3_9FUNG|nr:hypothetical protein INT48_003725 [Thamnidium elegans]
MPRRSPPRNARPVTPAPVDEPAPPPDDDLTQGLYKLFRQGMAIDPDRFAEGLIQALGMAGFYGNNRDSRLYYNHMYEIRFTDGQLQD